MSSRSEELSGYLVRDQMIVPFIINFVLNSVGPWLFFRGQETLPVWGDHGIAGDLVVTMVLLPFLVCLIATPLVRRMAKEGKTPTLTTLSTVPTLALRLPSGLFLRAVAVGVFVGVIAGPLVIAALKSLGWTSVGLVSFVLSKGVLCGVVALLISPLLALRAMADAQQPELKAPQVAR